MDSLVLSLILVVRDVEELDLVTLLGGGDDTEPVTELLLAEVLLGQVLEVTLGEGDVGVDPDFALACRVRKRDSAKRCEKTNVEVDIEDERA